MNGNEDRPTYSVQPADFTTPPECQGQMVEYSYARDAEAGVIVECCRDHSDQSVGYTAYADPDEDVFEPWNALPTLGAAIGPCQIEEPDIPIMQRSARYPGPGL